MASPREADTLFFDMPKSLDPAYLKELFEHHLPYEIGMMRYAYTVLATPIGQLAVNVHIEAFCLHVRNLLEFFESDKKYSVGAFVAPGWKRFDGVTSRQLSRMRSLLNNQISHLAVDQRTADPVKKIGHAERQAMLVMIETELERLRHGLAPGWVASWPSMQTPPTEEPSATNAIMTI